MRSILNDTKQPIAIRVPGKTWRHKPITLAMIPPGGFFEFAGPCEYIGPFDIGIARHEPTTTVTIHVRAEIADDGGG